MDIVTENINKRIIDLEVKKASIENDIPAKIQVGNYLTDIYNNSKNNRNYPSSLIRGTVTPINKKTTRTLLKKDYRPISLIPNISKLYEKNMHDQIYSYVDKFLSPYLFGYRKPTARNSV